MRCIGRDDVKATTPRPGWIATSLAVLLTANAGLAQEAEEERDNEAETTPTAQEAPVAAPPPAPASGGRTEVFIPTEKIPADAAISFPVDI